MSKFEFDKNREYSAKEILTQLDRGENSDTFPWLDNGYIFPITSKISTYRDETRWAIIIEVIGFNHQLGGHNGISNCLHIFGNCLDYAPGINDDNYLYITDNSSDGLTFDTEYEESLNPETKTMMLRDNEIVINHNREYYSAKGIELEEDDKICIWEFLRGLLPEYEAEFWATEKEIRERIPEDLPMFHSLTEWYHPDCANSEMPSNNETFVLIAKSLETGQLDLYKPTNEPNNHWKNWPEGGNL